MRYLISKLTATIAVLYIILSAKIDASTILISLFILLVTMLLTLVSHPKGKIILTSFFIIASLFENRLFYAFPLLVFDLPSLLMLPLLIVPLFYFEDFSFALILSLIIFSMKFLVDAAIAYEVTQNRIGILNDELKSLKIKESTSKEILNQEYQNEMNLRLSNERNRIARDIHDNVGHLLSRALIQLGALQVTNKDPQRSDAYQELKVTLDSGMNSIRESVHNLFEKSTDLEQEICVILEQFPQVQTNFEYKLTTLLPSQQSSAILAIIKEAMTNVVKHSNASIVTIRINESSQHTFCVISDNGSSSSTKLGNGIGLASIEKRVRLLNGLYNLQTENGYRIYINLPKEKI